MISSRNKRLVRLGAIASIASIAGIALASATLNACLSSDTNGTSGTNGEGLDATPGAGDSGGGDVSVQEDSSVPDADASVDASMDAGLDAPRDANIRDANGPGVVDAICSFNGDCQAALRCECDDVNGCGCKPGARGTGRNGIDPCTTGDACSSAVCVEGPPDSGSFCSDECGTSADCVGKLPLCTSVAFVGRICVRTPPP